MSSKVKGRRPRDSARDEFTSVLQDGKLKQQCNHCSQVIVNHTATLRNHLLRKHPTLESATTSASASATTLSAVNASSSFHGANVPLNVSGSLNGNTNANAKMIESAVNAAAAAAAVAVVSTKSIASLSTPGAPISTAPSTSSAPTTVVAANAPAIEENRANSSSECGSESSEDKEVDDEDDDGDDDDADEQEGEEDDAEGEEEKGNNHAASSGVDNIHNGQEKHVSACGEASLVMNANERMKAKLEPQHQQNQHNQPILRHEETVCASQQAARCHEDMEICTDEEATAKNSCEHQGSSKESAVSHSNSFLKAIKKRKHADVTAFADPNKRKLLDSDEFEQINQEMHEYDERRESIIKRSRDILKNSKQSIFALHRGSSHDATRLLSNATKLIPELVALTQGDQSLRSGILSSALEEYAEARCFQHYLDHGSLLPLTAMAYVNKEEYLGGVIDFTGELTRLAVMKAAKRRVHEVERCREMVEAISGELIQFDFRNGALRKKYDSLKYNLKKLENTIYELSLISSSGLTVNASSTQVPSETGEHHDME